MRDLTYRPTKLGVVARTKEGGVFEGSVTTLHTAQMRRAVYQR